MKITRTIQANLSATGLFAICSFICMSELNGFLCVDKKKGAAPFCFVKQLYGHVEMSSITEDMTENQWEVFCEIMLCHHYGQPYFWFVPDEDNGDYGIEFYTADGTIFQCYKPCTSHGVYVLPDYP